MFDKVKLHRSDLTIPAEHDGRHKLDTANPNSRESIPLIVHLPEEGIAFFTYTWVNSASSAGAMLCLFGPAIGKDQLTYVFPDRPVPADMDFSNWNIENFSMKNDLKFGQAEFHFANAEVQLDFTFEASHPPYAYGANKHGCPPYCADNRIEQSGAARGTLVLNGRKVTFDTTGHRDHSWGSRDWTAMQNYRWFEGQAGPNTAVHFWQLHALGQTRLMGYVFKDGLMAEVTALDHEISFDANFLQDHLSATITDEAGRTTKIIADFYAQGVLIPAPDLTLNEAAARITIDGKPGVGWLEHALPTDYLAHIRSIPAYTQNGKGAQ